MRLAIVCIMMLPVLASGQEFLDWNFDDGTMGPFTPLGPGWEVVDGSLHCYTEGFAFFSAAIAGDPAWGDYTVAADVRAEGSVNHTIRFRVVDFQDYYEVNLRAAPFNDLVIGRMDYLGYEVLQQVPATAEPGSWHRLEISVTGFTIAVRVDDTLVAVYTDSDQPEELAQGSIALVCLSGGEVLWQDIWFDNVTVSTPTVAVAPASLSAVRQLFR